MRTFSKRMWAAVAFIESGREHVRQLDEAFESFDGDAMCAALWTLAEARPRLKANLPTYVVYPSGRAASLLGLSMRAIRDAAAKQRASAYEAFNLGPAPAR